MTPGADASSELSGVASQSDVVAYQAEAEISISGKAHSLRGGQLVKLPARQPHAVRAITRFKMLLVMIKA